MKATQLRGATFKLSLTVDTAALCSLTRHPERSRESMHGSLRHARPSGWTRMTRVFALLAVTLLLLGPETAHAAFYGSQKKTELRAKARETWYHAYDSYKSEFSPVGSRTAPNRLLTGRHFSARRVCVSGRRAAAAVMQRARA